MPLKITLLHEHRFLFSNGELKRQGQPRLPCSEIEAKCLFVRGRKENRKRDGLSQSPLSLSLSDNGRRDGTAGSRGESKYWAKKTSGISITHPPTDHLSDGREEGAFLCIIEEEDEEGTKGREHFDRKGSNSDCYRDTQ